MPLDLQRIVGPIKVKGTPDDPVYVVVEGISIVTYNKTGSATNVPTTTKTTILSDSFQAGTFENAVVISVSGDVYAKYYFTVNGTDIDIRRSGPDRNLQFDFTGASYALTTGDIIDIKVEHFDVGLFNFDATFYGYS